MSDARDWQKKCIAAGFTYWREPDAHGVTCTAEQATALLQDLLGVEVEIEALSAPASPLIDIPPDARKGKPPCGECHLQAGETCDICGATQPPACPLQEPAYAAFVELFAAQDAQDAMKVEWRRAPIWRKEDAERAVTINKRVDDAWKAARAALSDRGQS